MKNLWIYLTLASMMLFAGCSKDLTDEVFEELPMQGEPITISVGLPEDAETRVALDAETLHLSWDEGDELLAVGIEDGKIANVSTLTQTAYVAGSKSASFTGTLEAAASYMLYYKTPQLQAEIGQPSVVMNYDGQTVGKSGDISSVKNYLFIHSAAYTAEELKNATTAPILLQSYNSVLEVNIASTPEGVAPITSLRWENNMGTAYAQSTDLNYTGAEPLTKGYISFDPAKMELKPNHKIAFIVHGATKIFSVSATSTAGKQYLAGRLYHATMSSEENTHHLHAWAELAPVIPNNEIWVKTTNNNQDAPAIRNGLSGSIQYDKPFKDDASGYWRIKRTDGQDIVDMGFSHMFNESNLTEAVLPSTLKILSPNAFSACYSLTKVWLPDNLEEISNECFYNCSSLVSIEFPEQLTTLGVQVFLNCTNLNSVIFKGNKLKVVDSAFKKCSSLQEVVIPEGVEALQGTFNDSGLERVSLPSTLKVIGVNTFSYTKLQSVDIPDAVEEIGDRAFAGCANLQAVNISENSQLKTLGEIFTPNNMLQSFYFPKHVTSVGSNFFRDSSVRTITFAPEIQLQEIPAYFALNSKIGTITIPQSVVSIGSSAFSSCKQLEQVNFAPNSQLTEINDHAFSQCDYISSPITFPKSLKTIGESAFAYASFPAYNFEAGSQLTTIGNLAFSDATNFTKFDCPDTVTSIGPLAFYATPLQEFHFPENDQFKTIASETFRFSSLKALHLPKNIEEIGADAFANIRSDGMSITCAEDSQLQIIRTEAFYNTDIQNMTLPRSLKTVEDNAFWGVFNINFPGTVTVLAPSTATIPPMGKWFMDLVLDRSWENTVNLNDNTWQGEQWGSITFIN